MLLLKAISSHALINECPYSATFFSYFSFYLEAIHSKDYLFALIIEFI